MKKSNTRSFLVTAILTLIANEAGAGTFTITSGPTFTPASAFTNSTIQVTVVHNPPGVSGDVVRMTGNATITPGSASSAMVDVSGNYHVDAGDSASASYSFILNSNYAGNVTYKLQGSVTVPFFGQQNFSKDGTVTPGLNLYRGTFQTPAKSPAAVDGTFNGTLQLNFSHSSAFSVAPESAETTAAAGSLDLSIEQFDLQAAPTEAAPKVQSQPLNIATRLAVQSGDNVLIAGFIITGNTNKKVIIRGIGPSLKFAGALQDPTLQLFQGNTSLATNDNWRENEAEVKATTIPPTDDRESAIVGTLAPGNYTAVLAGKNQTTGIGVVEVYDLGQANGRLANIASRGFVQAGNDVMIGGFILGPDNTSSSKVVVRALGPSLTAVGVPNALQDPLLELHDGNGTLIKSNDNWQDSPEHQAISDAGLAPSNPKEAAVLAVEPPAGYTAVVKGVGGTTGNALVELYHLQQ